MIFITLVLRQQNDGAAPVTPVLARVRQAFAEVLLVEQEIESTLEVKQVIQAVYTVEQTLEGPQ